MTSTSITKKGPRANGTKRRARTIAAIIVGACGALGALFLFRQDDRATRAEAPVVVEKNESKIWPPVFRPNADALGPLAEAPVREMSEANEEPERPGSDEWDDNPIGDLIRNIVDEDKNLGTFLYYYEHVLLDRESRKQYEALLASPEMYAEVKQDLLYPGEAKETLQGNVKRMVKLDYLREALVWDENPSRDALLDTIEQTLLEDNFPEDMSTDMRLSLATNKMELYALLYDHAPPRAEGVVQKAKGTRLEELIDFIAESIATRRHNEVALSTEVRP